MKTIQIVGHPPHIFIGVIEDDRQNRWMTNKGEIFDYQKFENNREYCNANLYFNSIRWAISVVKQVFPKAKRLSKEGIDLVIFTSE